MRSSASWQHRCAGPSSDMQASCNTSISSSWACAARLCYTRMRPTRGTMRLIGRLLREAPWGSPVLRPASRTEVSSLGHLG